MADRVLFASDVHLTPRVPEVAERFTAFLRQAEGARALYILGDLFDYWIGPKQMGVPGFSDVFPRLRALRDSGTELFFMAGNRDYMLERRFAAEQGLTTLPDVAEVTLGSKRVLLTHGDLLCTRDHAYHRMRRVIRSWWARRILRNLPLKLSLGLAAGFRGASGREIGMKPDYLLDPDFEEARRWLERGYDALVFGHVHTGERFRVRLPDREADIFVLGSWNDLPSYVEWDGGGLRLERFGAPILSA